jgi:phosphatidylinositol glycan class M
VSRIIGFVTPSRVKLTLAALASFVGLNAVMYIQYGTPFLQHTFFHHLTRIDHRHNFSPYSTLLYLSAAGGAETHFEALAFIPQLVLAVIALPLVLAKKSLTTAMLAQTFTFVTFNKVCTSQVSDFQRTILTAADMFSISSGTSFYYHSISLPHLLSASQA